MTYIIQRKYKWIPNIIYIIYEIKNNISNNIHIIICNYILLILLYIHYYEYMKYHISQIPQIYYYYDQ